MLPFPIYGPKTGLAMTFSAVASFDPRASAPDQAPTTFLASAAYSQKEQASLTLAPELYLAGGAYRLDARLGYEDWPAQFYGVGEDTRASDEEHYTSETTPVELTLAGRVSGGLWIGPAYRWIGWSCALSIVLPPVSWRPTVSSG